MANLDRVTVTGIGSGTGSRQNNGGNNKNGLRYFPPHRGKQQAMALFTFLQGFKVDGGAERGSPVGGRALAQRLMAYAANAVTPGPLMLISDLMDDGWMDGMSALASHGFEVTVLHLLSPDELDPPLSGDLKLLDSENDAEVEITADYDFLDRYRQGLRAWQEELRHFCAARGMVYVSLDTSLPLEELLFAWLRRLGVLK
jgi:uncharacterized protein (DUF58 family)